LETILGTNRKKKSVLREPTVPSVGRQLIKRTSKICSMLIINAESKSKARKEVGNRWGGVAELQVDWDAGKTKPWRSGDLHEQREQPLS
jgi:hypothetical protein